MSWTCYCRGERIWPRQSPAVFSICERQTPDKVQTWFSGCHVWRQLISTCSTCCEMIICLLNLVSFLLHVSSPVFTFESLIQTEHVPHHHPQQWNVVGDGITCIFEEKLMSNQRFNIRRLFSSISTTSSNESPPIRTLTPIMTSLIHYVHHRTPVGP